MTVEGGVSSAWRVLDGWWSVRDFGLGDEEIGLEELEHRAQAFRGAAREAGIHTAAPPALSPSPAVADEFFTLGEAARRLGRSVSSVRRAVKSGGLPGVMEHRAQGDRWMVLLPSADHPQIRNDPPSPSTTSEVEALRETVALLRGQLAHADSTLDMALGALRASQRATEQAQALAFSNGQALAALTAAPRLVEEPSQAAPHPSTGEGVPNPIRRRHPTHPNGGSTRSIVEGAATALVRSTLRLLFR